GAQRSREAATPGAHRGRQARREAHGPIQRPIRSSASGPGGGVPVTDRREEALEVITRRDRGHRDALGPRLQRARDPAVRLETVRTGGSRARPAEGTWDVWHDPS